MPACASEHPPPPTHPPTSNAITHASTRTHQYVYRNTVRLMYKKKNYNDAAALHFHPNTQHTTTIFPLDTHTHTHTYSRRPTRTPHSHKYARRLERKHTQTNTQTKKKKRQTCTTKHVCVGARTRVFCVFFFVCVRTSCLLQNTCYTRRTPKKSVWGLELLMNAAFSYSGMRT